MKDLPLLGCRIVYTRSRAHFAQSALPALGATVDSVPLMDTRPQTLCPDALAFAQQSHALIFTSAAAVRHFFAQSAWATATLAIAIGQATAQALREQGVEQSALLVAPAPYDSEALLGVWQPRGQRIGIIAAAGGRELLAKALGGENQVRIIECYQRYNPSKSYPTALPVPDAMLMGSVGTVNHLLQITPHSYLKLLKLDSMMVAISSRVADELRKHGFTQVLSAREADEQSQIQTICQWWQHK